MSNPFWVVELRARRDWPRAKPRSRLRRRLDLALRRERRVTLPAHRGRRAMASRRERPVTPRHQERPVMRPHLVVAAEPALLRQLVAAALGAAEFEQPH